MEDLLGLPTTREVPLYEKERGGRVRCCVCERRCRIQEGSFGWCKVRKNIGGTLYTIYYGEISGIESRPIEIKPFFHFYPGSSALTYSTWSCNLACPWCQNHHISKETPAPGVRYISPEEIIDETLRRGDDGVCVSFNEPTMLFEHSIDTFRLAKKRRLYTTFVSNGYMTKEALLLLIDAGLDAINIDIKGDEEVYREYCGGASVEVPWRNARFLKETGIDVEIINLIIPDVNDSETSVKALILRHLKEVGKDTPIHFTRYFPAYKFKKKETPIQTLLMAYRIAKEEGIRFPYLGNLRGHPFENTYCPRCGELLIERMGYSIIKAKIDETKRCPHCRESLPIKGEIKTLPQSS